MFKKLKLILIIVSSYYGVFGHCDPSAISVWPTSKTLNQNPIIIITGHGFDGQEIVLNWAKNKQLYLKSKSEKVLLIADTFYFGEDRVTQVVFKPAKQLRLGENYSIRVKGIGISDKLFMYEEKSKRPKRINWDVTFGVDSIPPNWANKPKQIIKSYVSYGCGPAYFAKFHANAEDKSQIAVKTTVTDLKTNRKTTFILTQFLDTIYVGKGMCGGPFEFASNSEYEVIFSLIDSSGNYLSWDEKPIVFTRPKNISE